MYILGTIRQSIAHNSTGGMELVSHDLYKGLVAAGFEVEVLTSSLKDQHESEKNIDGVKYIFIKDAPPGVYSSELHNGIKSYLQSLMDKNKKPLVIHSASGAAAAVIKNKYKIPVVATWHGTNIEQELDRMMSYVYVENKTLLPSHCEDLVRKICSNQKLRSDFQGFDGHVAISAFMKECIMNYGVAEKDIAVINNALPDIFFQENAKLDSFHKPNDKILLGLVGRPIAMKGYEFFNKVLQRLDPAKYELMVVTGHKDALEFFKDSKVKVHFVSVAREQIPSLYALMDVYINPTFRYSGFDLTVQEALISGTVVLNSDVRPYQNYYNKLQNELGEQSPFFTFRVGDVESCLGAINRIYVNKLTNNQIPYFKEQFKFQHMIEKYIKFFQDMNQRMNG